MMANNSFLENFKSKVTYENKTTYAAAMIILGFLVWGITHEYSGLFTILLIMIPSILLVIPNESIRNNRILGIILAILVIFMILMCIVNILTAGDAYNYHYYYDYSPGLVVFYNIILVIYSLLNLVSCYMLTIQTRKTESINNTNNSNINNSNINNQSKNFCKHCGTKLDKDSKFCPTCGNEI